METQSSIYANMSENKTLQDYLSSDLHKAKSKLIESLKHAHQRLEAELFIEELRHLY